MVSVTIGTTSATTQLIGCVVLLIPTVIVNTHEPLPVVNGAPLIIGPIPFLVLVSVSPGGKDPDVIEYITFVGSPPITGNLYCIDLPTCRLFNNMVVMYIVSDLLVYSV